MSSATVVDLTNVESRVAAEPIAQFLQANGVAAHVEVDDVSGLDPALAFVRGVRVQVPAEQLDTARELYEAYEKGSLEEGWEDDIDTIRDDAEDST